MLHPRSCATKLPDSNPSWRKSRGHVTAVFKLAQENARILETNLLASRERYKGGELTRTDVAQSEARLAKAKGGLGSAESDLMSASASYARLVGHAPANLQIPPPLPSFPADMDDAVQIAIDYNSDLAGMRKRREAAEKDVDIVKGSTLPKFSIYGHSEYANYLNSLGGVSAVLYPQSGSSAEVGVELKIPIFQGRVSSARVRQARAQESQAAQEEIGMEQEVIAKVVSAFAAAKAALVRIGTSEIEVDAFSVSLSGVRAENSVGRRTVLDVLNAQQELMNSQVELAKARRDSYVAGFTLLALMGKAEARNLNFESALLYEPESKN